MSRRRDYQALVIRLASDASQSYRRDLLQGTREHQFRIHLPDREDFRPWHASVGYYGLSGDTALAMSSCYGYQSGPMPGGQ